MARAQGHRLGRRLTWGAIAGLACAAAVAGCGGSGSRAPAAPKAAAATGAAGGAGARTGTTASGGESPPPRGTRARAGSGLGAIPRRRALAAQRTVAGPGAGGAHPAFGRAHPRDVPTPGPQLAAFRRNVNRAVLTFERSVWTSYESGTLRTKGSRAQTARAVGVVFGDIMQAIRGAQHGTAVRELSAPLAALAATLGNLRDSLRHGRLDAVDLRLARLTFAGIERSASSSGLRIA